MENKLDVTEETRYKGQSDIDNSKPRSVRYRLGQFSTPRNLADEILEYSSHLNTFKKIKFFDPAVGTGSFYTGLLRAYKANIDSALGYEIDPDYYQIAKDTWKDFSELQVIKGDFTQAEPEPTQKFNLLVCNPPYTRHHQIGLEAKTRLKEIVQKKFPYKLSGLSGLHIYFMLLSDQWMEKDGISIWLVPSEILEVNYGKIIKEYLLDKVELLRIHFFDKSDVQFSDALVSSCVIAFRHCKPNQSKKVEFSFGGSLLHPTTKKYVTKNELKHTDKWSSYLNVTPQETLLKANDLRKEYVLGDYFEVKRGIATGDNNFFVIDKNMAQSFDIPKKYLKNILPGSRYLGNDTIVMDKDGYLKTDKKLVVLDVDLPIEEIQSLYPKLYDYLVSGIEGGVNTKYLTSRRKPWYSQERRSPPDYFVRYMTREGVSEKSLVIKNDADAIATNTYLMIYEKKQPAIDSLMSQSEISTKLIEKLSDNIGSLGRTYGGGLIKFEPSELKQVSFKI